MVQEIKVDHSESYKIDDIKDSSCVTQCAAPLMEVGIMSPIPVLEEEEEKEEELKRRKREELIQYYIQKHEDFLKNPRICVDAIDHLYYLVPKAKRSKRKSCYSTVEPLLKRENKKLKMVHSKKPIEKKSLVITTTKTQCVSPMEKIQEKGVSISEDLLVMEKGGVPKIESLLKNEKAPMEKIQEKGVSISEDLLVMEKGGVPKNESLLKNEKRNKLVFGKEAVLPAEFKNKIQELGVPISEVSLVIEKPLFSTDLSEKHMRLSIPVKQVLNHDVFLTRQEKEILDTKDRSNRKSQIKFNLIEPSLEECSIHLAKWPMSSSSSYVLLNDWISVYKRNNLKCQQWNFGEKPMVPIAGQVFDAMYHKFYCSKFLGDTFCPMTPFGPHLGSLVAIDTSVSLNGNSEVVGNVIGRDIVGVCCIRLDSRHDQNVLILERHDVAAV
ncbi:hypothetical protein HAX54_005986 [Datura stramonium]|uniref:Uncharacterized protein n=1 Tax=Datura stramonium TaxID=4076 RepID=A0ABS8RHU3_DATST|nr:hypothetical protein [Datura stramonium]